MKRRSLTLFSLIILSWIALNAQVGDKVLDQDLKQEAILASQLCTNILPNAKKNTIKICEDALLLSREYGMDSLTVINLCHLANKLHFKEGPEASYKYLVEAKQIAEKNKNEVLKIPAYYYYSLIWERYINIDVAVDYLHQALEIANNIDDSHYQSMVFSGIGFLFTEEELYEDAKEYFTDGLKAAQERDDQASIAHMERYLAIPYRELGDFQRARSLYLKSYDYYESKLDTVAMQIIAYGLGKLASKQGDYELSNRIFFGKLDSLGISYKSSKFIKEIIADNYFHLKQYQQSLNLYKEIEPEATQINDLRLRKSIFKGVADCYSRLGQFEKASDYYQKYTYEADASIKEKLRNSASTADLKYRLRSKDAKNKYLLAEKENIVLQSRAKTLMLIAIVMILALISMILYFVYNKQKKRNSFLKAISLEQEKNNNDLLNQSKEKDVLNQELASRNLELSTFAGNVAHDVKAPLRTTISFVNLLKRHIQQDSRIDEYLKFIENSNQQLSVLIDDLLAFTRSGKYSQEIELVDLNNVIHIVRNNLTLQIKKRSAEIKADQLPCIHANISAMIQLFQNLIVNAIKFTMPNKTPFIKISSESGMNYHTITISDNGIGIEEKYLEKIFDPLIKLHSKDKYEGSGLGLATCRKIIEHLDGTISVSSVPDEGSVFVLKFPRKHITQLSGEAKLTREING